jgi:hypothetical protein
LSAKKIIFHCFTAFRHCIIRPDRPHKSEIHGHGLDEGCFFSCCEQNPMRAFTTVVPPRHPWVIHQTLFALSTFFKWRFVSSGHRTPNMALPSSQFRWLRCKFIWQSMKESDFFDRFRSHFCSSLFCSVFLHCSIFCSLLSSQCLTCSILWGSGRSFKSSAPIVEWISVFCAAPFLFVRSAAQKWKGTVRQPPGTNLSPGGFLKKREPRVAETAVDTQLGLGQVRSGSSLSINWRFATVLFFLLLKPFRNAWRLPRIGVFPFQLWTVGEIFKFSFLLAFEKGHYMVNRMDQNFAPCVREWICDWVIQEKQKYRDFWPNFWMAKGSTELEIVKRSEVS